MNVGLILTVINVHSPTLEKHEERRRFYEEISDVYVKYKADALVFVAGDWNARVGRKLADETCVGLHGSLETRNDAGKDLVTFCEARDLFLCNTAFRHRWSHRATWRKPTSTDTAPKQYQIDYILCRRSNKGLLTDSRAYPGTTYESDHSLVVVRLSVDRFRGRGHEDKKKKKQQEAVRGRGCVRRELLVEKDEIRLKFEAQVASNLGKIDREASPGRRWQAGLEVLMAAAASTAGLKAKAKRFEDQELQRLSHRHMELRLEITNPSNRKYPSRLKALKAEANAISHQLRRRITELETQKLDSLAKRIEEHKGG